MYKLDLTKTYKSYYKAKTTPETIKLEPVGYLSIRGKGDPSGPEFASDIEALYSTAYTIKFNFKDQNKDFVVAKLEGLWWYDTSKYKSAGMSDASIDIPRSEWEYRLLIRMPDFVRDLDVTKAIKAAFTKKGIERINSVEFYQMNEGLCVQMLHVGPFSEEPKSLAIMETFIDKHQYKQNGYHHEIYLSDFRKTAPEKLKTILREPVKI